MWTLLKREFSLISHGDHFVFRNEKTYSNQEEKLSKYSLSHYLTLSLSVSDMFLMYRCLISDLFWRYIYTIPTKMSCPSHLHPEARIAQFLVGCQINVRNVVSYLAWFFSFTKNLWERTKCWMCHTMLCWENSMLSSSPSSFYSFQNSLAQAIFNLCGLRKKRAEKNLIKMIKI